MKLSLRHAALAAASFALVAGPAAVSSPAHATYPVPEGGSLSQLRQDTVNRAKAALVNPKKFRLSEGGTTHNSTVMASAGRNLLEIDGSNKNINQYNDYRVNPWCGYFAAAMWTGQNTPNAADFPRIPDSYASSQAWRTGVGSQFRAFNGAGGVKPQPGDVLVWQNIGDTAHGHVGVVISYNYDTDKVTTIEGNVNGDEIARKVYAWDSNGPSIADKKFTGFADRD